ncbi:MAG: hypothetical protein M3Q29_09340 [Chloroflexota bacterium]|nr:hypothetical protein [Chloroflexota bacterium]
MATTAIETRRTLADALLPYDHHRALPGLLAADDGIQNHQPHLAARGLPPT